MSVLTAVATASVPVMLISFHCWKTLAAMWRTATLAFMVAVTLACGAWAVASTRSNIINPAEWDFLCFWLWGRMAVEKVNFYQPQSHYSGGLAEPWSPSSEFKLAVLDVGFKYPPPTMFLFMPLGWSDVHRAALLWSVSLAVVLALDIVLLWRIFLVENGIVGLMLAAALVLTLRSTMSTIALAQTNFIALLALLLLWVHRDRMLGGAWLAIGICTKPFIAVFGLYLLLRRYWEAVVSTLATLAVLFLLSITAFGWHAVLDYFVEHPASREPDFIYTEGVNQSVLATVLRSTGQNVHAMSTATQFTLLLVVLILSAVTGWLVYRVKASQAGLGFSLTLGLGLLLYPASLEHYSVLLIVPMLLLWARRRELPLGALGVGAFITLEFGLINIPRGRCVFVATALMWLVVAAVILWTLGQQKALGPHASASP